jgi:hypothetical protein
MHTAFREGNGCVQTSENVAFGGDRGKPSASWGVGPSGQTWRT